MMIPRRQSYLDSQEDDQSKVLNPNQSQAKPEPEPDLSLHVKPS